MHSLSEQIAYAERVLFCGVWSQRIRTARHMICPLNNNNNNKQNMNVYALQVFLLLRSFCVFVRLTGLSQSAWGGTAVLGCVLSNLDRASLSICSRCCSNGKSPYVKNLQTRTKHTIISIAYTLILHTAFIVYIQASDCYYLALLGW